MIDGRPSAIVLMGGPDAEWEVSLWSGRAIAQALRESGRFEVREHVVGRPSAPELAALGGDVIFPVLHGRWGEGGPLQEILEGLGVPYVGSGPAAAKLAMDKLATKRAVAEAGIRTPPARRLRPQDPCELDPPLVLKPVDEGSSVDLFICRTAADIVAARGRLHGKGRTIMAEAYVTGREVTAGIIDGEPTPLVEIIPSAEFYDYEAKYLRDDTRYVVDPALPGDTAEECTWAALAAFNRIGCRDLARADFIVNDRDAWFLEINTMPGFTTHSLVPMAAAAAGRDMPALCAGLAEAALAREPQAAQTGGVS